MELVDLVGAHTLDGVDYDDGSVIPNDNYTHASAISFRFDGAVYTAIEDPDDGLRSKRNSFWFS